MELEDIHRLNAVQGRMIAQMQQELNEIGKEVHALMKIATEPSEGDPLIEVLNKLRSAIEAQPARIAEALQGSASKRSASQRKTS